MDCIQTRIVYPDRDRRFCPDARIELPGYCPEIGPNASKMSSPKKCSHRNSCQNGPVDRSTALTTTIFINIYEKTSFSQNRSHQNSGQNGPIERSTALTGTIFVNISVLMSRAQKVTPIPKKVVITKTLALKFCAELSNREIHSSHGDYFRDHFYVYVSGPKS